MVANASCCLKIAVRETVFDGFGLQNPPVNEISDPEIAVQKTFFSEIGLQCFSVYRFALILKQK